MEIKDDYDFNDLQKHCWGQAISTLDDILEAGLKDELMDYLEECFGEDIPTLTQVNDVLAYEWENVFKSIGYFNLEDSIDTSAIEDIISEIDMWIKPRMITNSDLEAYDDLEYGRISESELSKQIDEIKENLVVLKDSLNELLDCESEDELDDKKYDVSDNLSKVDVDYCMTYLNQDTYNKIENDIFKPLSKLV